MKPVYALVGVPTLVTGFGFVFGGPLFALLCLFLSLVIGAGVVEEPEAG